MGHILRAAARAAAATELDADGGAGAATAALDRAQRRATPVLLDVLLRYPPVAGGRNRTAQLMQALDTALRGLPVAPDDPERPEPAQRRSRS